MKVRNLKIAIISFVLKVMFYVILTKKKKKQLKIRTYLT